MKLRAIAISGVLVLVLAGCGGTSEPAATPIQITATITVEAPPEPTSTTRANLEPTVAQEVRPTNTVASVVEPANTTAPQAETPAAQGGEVVTYQEIADQRKTLTEAQWPAYEKELIGKRIEGAKGYVHQVDEELMGDRPALRVDLDKPSGVLDAYELEVIIPETDATKLNKAQPVTVSGTIDDLECFMTYCNVKLVDGSFTAEGTLTEPVFEKQTEVTHEQINQKRKEITYAQWDLYMASIRGASITGSGYVEDVRKGFLNDDFEVQIDLQPPAEAISSYEIKVPVATDDAAKFSKDQEVSFSGTIQETECFLDYCTVTVEGTVTAR